MFLVLNLVAVSATIFKKAIVSVSINKQRLFETPIKPYMHVLKDIYRSSLVV